MNCCHDAFTRVRAILSLGRRPLATSASLVYSVRSGLEIIFPSLHNDDIFVRLLLATFYIFLLRRREFTLLAAGLTVLANTRLAVSSAGVAAKSS